MMHSQIAILSEDPAFSRLLELEFEYLHLQAVSYPAFPEGLSADVLILDLDSAEAPPTGNFGTVIGCTRRPALSAENARSCSMILRRPFRMSLLRTEVLRQTGKEIYTVPYGEPIGKTISGQQEQTGKREILVDSEKRILYCDRTDIPLTPQECRVMQCLLENRGKTVSRDLLAEKIGVSDANKTDVYICYLRRKTDRLPRGRLIFTARREGYRID